jgi:DNA-binding transcriptional MerR regulator
VAHVERDKLISIGEFSRLSDLSPKALRLYDELGLLPPASVDPANGYRFYGTDQLRTARLVSSLRKLDLPLTAIREIVLVNDLKGVTPHMYEVLSREMPERTLLCLERHVDEEAVWAFGKEFIAILRERPIRRVEGIEEAAFAFAIYHGEVSKDSDGPVEWCCPIPTAYASEIAPRYPELTLRTEPAHSEAYVDIGPGGQLPVTEWPLIGDALRHWAADNSRQPSDLGARITYFAPPPRTEGSVPDCDFAIPLR